MVVGATREKGAGAVINICASPFSFLLLVQVSERISPCLVMHLSALPSGPPAQTGYGSSFRAYPLFEQSTELHEQLTLPRG